MKQFSIKLTYANSKIKYGFLLGSKVYCFYHYLRMILLSFTWVMFARAILFHLPISLLWAYVSVITRVKIMRTYTARKKVDFKWSYLT